MCSANTNPFSGLLGLRVGTQVSHRIVDILQVLRSSNVGGARLQDVVRLTGLPQPTAHRLLAELCALGLVERTGGRLYRLGPALNGLGIEAPGPDYDDPAIRGIVEDLARDTEDTTYLAIRVFDGVRFLHRCEGRFAVRTQLAAVGETKAFCSSYAGIALMASLDDRAVSTILHAPTFESDHLWSGLDLAFIRSTIVIASTICGTTAGIARSESSPVLRAWPQPCRSGPPRFTLPS